MENLINTLGSHDWQGFQHDGIFCPDGAIGVRCLVSDQDRILFVKVTKVCIPVTEKFTNINCVRHATWLPPVSQSLDWYVDGGHAATLLDRERRGK